MPRRRSSTGVSDPLELRTQMVSRKTVAGVSTTISRTHLAVGADARGAYVTDRGSTNGTALVLPDGSYEPCPVGVQTRVLGADGVERTANQDCGPIAHVDVTQPGRYQVVATYNGVSKEQTVNLAPASGQRVHMQW